MSVLRELLPGSTAEERFGNAVAASRAMCRAFQMLERLVELDIPLTLSGETGTGKSLLARALHEKSPRTDRPFVVLDCATPALEVELLGHEGGGVGAEPCLSAFERAEGGTLFLDSVGELPLELQARLLRALEERTVRRVGGRRDHPVNARVVAATYADLQREVEAGRFRKDLFFRLAGAWVAVPPLRDRTEDLPLLVRDLLAELGRPELGVSESALATLRAHVWPGNVRELKNTLACALALVDADSPLSPEHLRLITADSAALERLPLAGQRLDCIEKAAIKLTLTQVGGNKIQAAKVLGIAVSTLYVKLKRYELS